ncbi:DEAD/DEAH box helicase [Aliiroseovarius sediminis]|uniref:DEAD/DEAH box helicase n=1 Tax=uncultured Aliiroseovarius sp. TaxID=1658783 RepID=UPI001F589F7D|nr:DEAD/DEAH box helicase [Aliiroseovarius sediminis]MCI2393694.1 DEAD/DEAH box helicase [Aliiroseovarius sediminis]
MKQQNRRTVKQPISDALAERGYDTLTQVQTAVSDPDLLGADLLVSAQTGSGKTVGFGLAIAPVLLGDDDQFGPAASPLGLVIAPTRELAMQVKRELIWLFAKTGAVVASCVGGMDMRDERRALARGAHIVVATPGRLRDHVMRGSIDLSALRSVVLDEADEMLDLGFREDLEFILDETPEDRQTLLFSATVPKSIATLAARYQKDAHRVTTVAEKSQHSDIEYRAMAVAPRDGENAIINVLRFFEAPNALIFCNTRAMVSRLATRLSNRGFSVVALSGELTQNERSNALQSMRDGRARICVATDVAARGIDLPKLDLVIHAELPNNHETLLHRSGRTGRAGRKGVSVLIVPPVARKKAERLLRFAKLSADWGPAPSAQEVQAEDQKRILADEVWAQEPTANEAALAEELVETFTPAQLAAAYLKLYHTAHAAPEELSPANAKPEKREPFGPSVWFTLAKGRNQGADPRHLLPMLCKAGGMSRGDIGAIRLQDDQSFFEVKADKVPGFLSSIGTGMSIEGFGVNQLDTPPDLARAGKPAPRGKPRKFDKVEPKPHRKGPAKSAAPSDRKPNPKHKWKDDKDADRPIKAYAKTKDEDRKPRKASKHDDDKPKGKRPTDDKKGPPPPKGKASSKKNRARAAAKAVAKAKGGDAAPKRRKG